MYEKLKVFLDLDEMRLQNAFLYTYRKGNLCRCAFNTH